MSLAKKLNLKAATKLRVLGKPKEVDLGDVEVTSLANVKDVLVFVTRIAELDRLAGPMLEAALADRIAWTAYSEQLGVNRQVGGKAGEMKRDQALSGGIGGALHGG